ncbi:MAG: hypothetical protein Q9217_005654, partial [Psora testacea]
MPPPTTPTKPDDGIEEIKRTLTAKWNLQFPARDSNWSPSKKDPTSLPDRVQGVIQYLYYGKGPALGALDYAIEQFDAQASLIVSKWQFKPRAELGIIPTHREPSALNRDFLHKRKGLSGIAREELMKCLHHHLTQVADKVRNGRNYVEPGAALSSIEDVKVRKDESGPALVGKDRVPTKTMTYRQSTLSQSFRSKSDPTAEHVSSEDLMDDDTSKVLPDVYMPDAEHDVSNRKESSSRRSSWHTSSADETFETPPTTPPSNRAPPSDLDGNLVAYRIDDDVKASLCRRQGDFMSARKRPCPETEKIVPRKLSRDTSKSGSMSLTATASHAKYYGPSYPTAPDYERQPLMTNRTMSLQTSWLSTCSTATSGSFNSSKTAASSNLTSPNTSFSTLSMDSRSTSFDQLSEGTESTIRTSLKNTRLQSHEPTALTQDRVGAGPTYSGKQPELGSNSIDSRGLESRRVKER